jgi:hypothetical protein
LGEQQRGTADQKQAAEHASIIRRSLFAEAVQNFPIQDDHEIELVSNTG